MNTAQAIDVKGRALEPQAVGAWNRYFSVGNPVIARRADGACIETHTVGRAYLDDRGRARVVCAGIGGVLLCNVEPV